jgi:hypothetical protein
MRDMRKTVVRYDKTGRSAILTSGTIDVVKLFAKSPGTYRIDVEIPEEDNTVTELTFIREQFIV